MKKILDLMMILCCIAASFLVLALVVMTWIFSRNTRSQ